MAQLCEPQGDYSLVIRTDFSDEATWEHLCAEVKRPRTEDGFKALVECISDRSFEGLDTDSLPSVVSKSSEIPFVFLADSEAISNPEHPLLVVDLEEKPGRSFRVIPPEAWSVENNLRLANMDWEEFSEAVDDDGVFRGFG